VICLSAFFRGYQLPSTPPGLFFDEAANGTDALHAIHSRTWAVFYPQNGGREGLFINLQSLRLRATGIREPWVLRSVSAAFGVLTVLGVILLGKELLGQESALIAGFFMSVGFWHVNFSRIGLRAIAAPFFLTWALFLLIVSYRAGNRSLAWDYSPDWFSDLVFTPTPRTAWPRSYSPSPWFTYSGETRAHCFR
jgi:4-amino-4-deoxy-L-arabinose transferase-like glycosyltransferase